MSASIASATAPVSTPRPCAPDSVVRAVSSRPRRIAKSASSRPRRAPASDPSRTVSVPRTSGWSIVPSYVAVPSAAPASPTVCTGRGNTPFKASTSAARRVIDPPMRSPVSVKCVPIWLPGGWAISSRASSSCACTRPDRSNVADGRAGAPAATAKRPLPLTDRSTGSSGPCTVVRPFRTFANGTSAPITRSNPARSTVSHSRSACSGTSCTIVRSTLPRTRPGAPTSCRSPNRIVVPAQYRCVTRSPRRCDPIEPSAIASVTSSTGARRSPSRAPSTRASPPTTASSSTTTPSTDGVNVPDRPRVPGVSLARAWATIPCPSRSAWSMNSPSRPPLPWTRRTSTAARYVLRSKTMPVASIAAVRSGVARPTPASATRRPTLRCATDLPIRKRRWASSTSSVRSSNAGRTGKAVASARGSLGGSCVRSTVSASTRPPTTGRRWVRLAMTARRASMCPIAAIGASPPMRTASTSRRSGMKDTCSAANPHRHPDRRAEFGFQTRTHHGGDARGRDPAHRHQSQEPHEQQRRQDPLHVRSRPFNHNSVAQCSAHLPIGPGARGRGARIRAGAMPSGTHVASRTRAARTRDFFARSLFWLASPRKWAYIPFYRRRRGRPECEGRQERCSYERY